MYEHDNKNSPFKKILALNWLVLDQNFGANLVNANNIVKITSNGDFIEDKIRYKYTYDRNGYPTQSVMNYTWSKKWIEELESLKALK